MSMDFLNTAIIIQISTPIPKLKASVEFDLDRYSIVYTTQVLLEETTFIHACMLSHVYLKQSS